MLPVRVLYTFPMRVICSTYCLIVSMFTVPALIVCCLCISPLSLFLQYLFSLFATCAFHLSVSSVRLTCALLSFIVFVFTVPALTVCYLCIETVSPDLSVHHDLLLYLCLQYLLWLCFTSTETIRLMGRGEGGMEVGEEGDHVPIATLSPPEWLLH